MYRNLLAFLPLAALAGCSHEPRQAMSPVTPILAPASYQTQTGSRTRLVPPEKDVRYQMPRAQSRSLTIFLDSQTFEYVEDGEVFASGDITSGTDDHPTPTGSFRVLSKNKDKRSGSYTNYYNDPTPMPYSLQFRGPYYVHEGYMPGYRDSHGCVRLHYEDARLLFDRMRTGDAITIMDSGVARSQNALAAFFPLF